MATERALGVCANFVDPRLQLTNCAFGLSPERLIFPRRAHATALLLGTAFHDDKLAWYAWNTFRAVVIMPNLVFFREILTWGVTLCAFVTFARAFCRLIKAYFARVALLRTLYTKLPLRARLACNRVFVDAIGVLKFAGRTRFARALTTSACVAVKAFGADAERSNFAQTTKKEQDQANSHGHRSC
jgi:hypothetical protein